MAQRPVKTITTKQPAPTKGSSGRPKYAPGGQGNTALKDNIWSQSEVLS